MQRFPGLGDKQPISTDGGFQPLWSPDGSELFYRTGQGNLFIMASDVETEPVFRALTPQELFPGAAYDAVGEERMYDIGPDGDRFLLLKFAGEPEPNDERVFEGPVVVLNWFEELKELVPVE